MPLTQKHRSSIYRSLVPILGEEEAEALMSELPAREADEVASKAFVRAEVSELRGDMYEQFAKVQEQFAHVHEQLAKVHEQVAKVHEGLRMQTVWCCGAIFAAVGLVATITTLG